MHNTDIDLAECTRRYHLARSRHEARVDVSEVFLPSLSEGFGPGKVEDFLEEEFGHRKQFIDKSSQQIESNRKEIGEWPNGGIGARSWIFVFVIARNEAIQSSCGTVIARKKVNPSETRREVPLGGEAIQDTRSTLLFVPSGLAILD